MPEATLAGTRRRLGRIGLILLGLVAILAGMVIWQQISPRRAPATAQRLAGQGRRAFADRCAACHGARLEGGSLADGTAVPPLDKPSFRLFFTLLPAAMEGWVREQIRDGNAIMPGFGRTLDGGTLDALAYYLRAVNTRAIAPGPAPSSAALAKP